MCIFFRRNIVFFFSQTDCLDPVFIFFYENGAAAAHISSPKSIAIGVRGGNPAVAVAAERKEDDTLNITRARAPGNIIIIAVVVKRNAVQSIHVRNRELETLPVSTVRVTATPVRRRILLLFI